MLATISFVVGIILGVLALVVTRRKKASEGEAPVKDGALQWVVLVFGILAIASLAGAMLNKFIARLFGVGFGLILSELNLYNVSIALAFAAVIAGIGGLVRGERRWPMWVGTILAVVPALIWLVFAVGEFLYPH
ncbi:MAG: hypothetical protein HGA54_02665 [Actinobacteria bacterium]|nr:hypothetical protein [Actinomycetota bacterium]